MIEVRRIKHPQHPGTVPDWRTMEPVKTWVLLGSPVTVRLPSGDMILDYVVAILTEATTYDVPVMITHNGYRVYEDEATYRQFGDWGYQMYERLNALPGGGLQKDTAEKLIKSGWLEVPDEPDP